MAEKFMDKAGKCFDTTNFARYIQWGFLFGIYNLWHGNVWEVFFNYGISAYRNR